MKKTRELKGKIRDKGGSKERKANQGKRKENDTHLWNICNPD